MNVYPASANAMHYCYRLDYSRVAQWSSITQSMILQQEIKGFGFGNLVQEVVAIVV
jgi:hypothetical protein